MAQLVQLTHRIHAVDTIKKITHATRLISMSAHTRLAGKEPLLTNYRNEIGNLFGNLLAQNTLMQNPLFTPSPTAKGSLIVLIGSQKGLCGTFNVALFKFFETQVKANDKNSAVIVVGKKAQEYLTKRKIAACEVFNNLSTATLPTITELITQYIINHASNFEQTIVVSNQPLSFFSQRPTKTIIFPSAPATHVKSAFDEYVWEESYTDIVQMLARLYLRITIQSLLFSSLVSEQAARFQSMDNATRNAQDLLEIMHRDYNKLRQAKITKELLELASSFKK